MSLDRRYRWALGITGALTVVALLMDEPMAPAKPSQRSGALPHASGSSSDLTVRQAVAAVEPLRQELRSAGFESPAKDLFAAVSQPVAPPPAPPPVTQSSPPPPPPPPPAPTAVYAGRLNTPEGQTLVFLRDGSQTIVAQPGAVLNNGYVVEALVPAPAATGSGRPSADIAAVQLLNTAREHRVTLPLPPSTQP